MIFEDDYVFSVTDERCSYIINRESTLKALLFIFLAFEIVVVRLLAALSQFQKALVEFMMALSAILCLQ